MQVIAQRIRPAVQQRFPGVIPVAMVTAERTKIFGGAGLRPRVPGGHHGTAGHEAE